MLPENLTFSFLNLNFLKLVIIGETCIGEFYHYNHQLFLFRIKSVGCRRHTRKRYVPRKRNTFCFIVGRDMDTQLKNVI